MWRDSGPSRVRAQHRCRAERDVHLGSGVLFVVCFSLKVPYYIFFQIFTFIPDSNAAALHDELSKKDLQISKKQHI